MALITPEVGQRSFETCDVATVDPNGNGSRVWLVNGDTITYANTTAAAMAALIVNDSAQPLMAGPIVSATFGESIYIGAQNVAHTRQLGAVPPSSLVTMTGGPGPFVVTALVADLNDDLNATARCGGGGSGVELAETFEPEVESLQEDLTVTVGPNANDKWGVVRLASTNSEEQSMFIISGWFELQSAADITTAPLFNVDLPYQMAPSTIAASVEARDAGSSDAPLAVSVSVTSLTQLRVHGSIANGQVAAGYVWAMFQGTIAE